MFGYLDPVFKQAFMQRILFFILMAIAAGNVSAQHQFVTVDRNAVEKAVTDTSASTYYPRLLARFNAFDTTLTAAEYRLLYYGFAFQKAYDGYVPNKTREINTALTEKKFSEALKLSDETLAKAPVSLDANFKKMMTLGAKDKSDPLYLRYSNRYDKLLETILTTGNGLTCKTSFKVLYISDEYNILAQFFRITGIKGQSLQGFCDRFSIEPTSLFKTGEVFFDTYESLMSMERRLK